MDKAMIVPGAVIGRWTVLDSDEKTARGERKWLCRCECGNEVDVAYNTLVYTNQKSCGCQKKGA